MTDLKGVVTHWNPASETMLGWSESEAIGRGFMELTAGPRDIQEAEAIMASIARDGAWQGELEVQRKNGSRFPAMIQNARIADVTGQPVGVLGIIVDLSDRVESERRLHSAYRHLEAITDAITDGVVTVDGSGRLDYLNPAALSLLGWSREELEGKVMHDVVHYRRPDGSPFPIEECPLRHPRQGDETIHVDDDMFIRRDGSELRVEYTSAPFETEDGNNGSVVIFRDIAARKAREEVLEKRIESLSWIGRIRDALHKELFVVHAQPIFDLGTGEIAFHELLIRMQADDGSIIPPGQFLSIAEEFSIIAEIDHWMIDQAARLAADGLAVTVNLSAQTIGSQNIGSVFQDFKLLMTKTVAENVAFALEVIGQPKHVIRTQVPAILELVGLEGKSHRYPHELSGGEQQRVSVARAFVNRPLILLADEPTGNLDPTTSVGIMRLLDRINRTGTTVVMATHDRSIVDTMQRRVIELELGEIIRDQARGVYQ